MPTGFNGRTRAADRSRTLRDAQIVKLVKAVRNLFATEELVGPSTYRQSAEFRLLVREHAERVAEAVWERDE